MSWQGRGSTRKWRAKRRRILDRDGHRCQLQLNGCRGVATTVHHLTAWRGDPGEVPDRLLQAACEPCNHQVGDPRGHDPRPQPRTTW